MKQSDEKEKKVCCVNCASFFVAVFYMVLANLHKEGARFIVARKWVSRSTRSALLFFLGENSGLHVLDGVRVEVAGVKCLPVLHVFERERVPASLCAKLLEAFDLAWNQALQEVVSCAQVLFEEPGDVLEPQAIMNSCNKKKIIKFECL